MFQMQEAIARERSTELRRQAAERRLARQVASLALWARVAAIVAARRVSAEDRLGESGNVVSEPAGATVAQYEKHAVAL